MVTLSLDILEPIHDIEIIAVGKSIREINRLTKFYGAARWRKLKGLARIRLANGSVWLAELHWYEANGVGRKDLKIKRLLEEQNE